MPGTVPANGDEKGSKINPQGAYIQSSVAQAKNLSISSNSFLLHPLQDC